jgi:nicotinamidase/pyrazinamidase
MPFGSLPAKHGDEVVGVANDLMPRFEFVVASQDWHPADHGSFASNHPGKNPGDIIDLAGERQILWPDHCVQNRPGASFHSGLDVTGIDAVIHKGTDPQIDSYSCFFDNAHRKDTGLADVLRSRRVEEIWLAGLATDYCVRWTARDGLDAGFGVVIVADGVRAVDLARGDGARAIAEMRDAGCRIVTASEAR